jgi:hypothetical protein
MIVSGMRERGNAIDNLCSQLVADKYLTMKPLSLAARTDSINSTGQKPKTVSTYAECKSRWHARNPKSGVDMFLEVLYLIDANES